MNVIGKSIVSCLLPYTAISSSSKPVIVIYEPKESMEDQMHALAKHRIALKESLQQLCIKGYCNYCDITRIEITDVMSLANLESICRFSLMIQHTPKELNFDRFTDGEERNPICTTCALKIILTAFPMEALEMLEQQKCPKLIGVPDPAELLIFGEFFCPYSETLSERM